MARAKGPPPGPQTPLTAKQARFVEEYVVDMNALRAARRAGYSARSSSSVNVMRLPQVKAAVAAALEVKRGRAGVDADRVLAALREIAFANILDYGGPDAGGRWDFDLTRVGREVGGAIAAVTIDYFPEPDGAPRRVSRVSVRMADKLGALRDLIVHLGLEPASAASWTVSRRRARRAIRPVNARPAPTIANR